MHAKQIFFKIGTKNALFVRFWAVILKDYQRMGLQHFWICQNAKLWAKIKILKFGTKSFLSRYF